MPKTNKQNSHLKKSRGKKASTHNQEYNNAVQENTDQLNEIMPRLSISNQNLPQISISNEACKFKCSNAQKV